MTNFILFFLTVWTAFSAPLFTKLTFFFFQSEVIGSLHGCNFLNTVCITLKHNAGNELEIYIFGRHPHGFKLQLNVEDREGASGGEERAEWEESHVQKSKCTLVTKLKLALPLALYTLPFSLLLSLSLSERLSLSLAVTRSPQPIKCGELVVNFSPHHTHKHTKQLRLVGLWLCCYYSSHVSTMFLIIYLFFVTLHLLTAPCLISAPFPLQWISVTQDLMCFFFIINKLI